jgi:CelD/BcsL family acetyltransferase involved in cellulose biosynthesis
MRRGDLPAPPGAWHRVATVRQSEDFIIDLPDSVEEYSAGLGRLARRNMSYYVRRLQRERGDSLHWVEAMGADIALEHYQQLVAMNRSRIESKGSRSLWDDSLARRRFALARETGLLFGMFFGKELVGGTLTYLHGDQAYLVLVAHDPTYERLNVGSACMWLTIRRLIHLKIKHCHLLWGAAFHKSQFGGQMQPLFEMSVFETPVAAVVWHGVRFGNALERARQALGRRGRRLVAKWRQRSIPESRVVS